VSYSKQEFLGGQGRPKRFSYQEAGVARLDPATLSGEAGRSVVALETWFTDNEISN